MRSVIRLGFALAFVTILGANCSRHQDESSVPITIAATDSGFTAPDTLQSGLNHIVYDNRGTMIHECMFIRLPETTTPEQYLQAVRDGADFPPGAIDCSGPGLTSPGETLEMWLTLEPGEYLLGCWNKSHLTKIAPQTLTVVAATGPLVDPPHEDVTIRLIDFRFEVDGEIEPGVRTLKIETVGPSMHEMDMFRFHGARTRAEFMAWYDGDRVASPPATAMGGALDSHDIQNVVWLRRRFTMGHYFMICEMPMVQNASPADSAANVTHAHAGMTHEFTVE
jgi:hypothetical protein